MGVVDTSPIKIWVIYQQPTDFPGVNFVMREHHIYRRSGNADRGATPTENVYKGDTIDQLRRKIPQGKQRMIRSEADEPQIVEWWF